MNLTKLKFEIKANMNMSNNQNTGIKQQGANLNNVNFTGENNTFSNIGNTNYNTYINKNVDFFEPNNLSYPKITSFLSPNNIDEIFDNLLVDRVLILGGNSEDKKYLALYFADRIRKSEFSTVWEWNGNASPQSLLGELKGETLGTSSSLQRSNRIFILSDFFPRHINNQIHNLKTAAHEGNNYVIVITDVPKNKWIITNNLTFWDTSANPPQYKSEDIIAALVDPLRNKTTLGSDIELYIKANAINKFKSFAEITYCLQVLLNQESISEKIINEAIDCANENREQSLNRWFYSLDKSEQLLAIGLSLFDDLFEDQFFAALETVVADVWQRRDPSLVALDYQDLENLGNYYELHPITYYDKDSQGFKFVKTERYPTEFAASLIRIRNSNDRQRLLKLAWKTHRRQIMNALGAIVKIVQKSARQEANNWELYGTSLRRDRLHHTVSQTLSSIGLGESSAASEVRYPLLELASDLSVEVKDVAAVAIAQWYIDGRTQDQSLSLQRFFGTLTHFWRIATDKQQGDSETQVWREHIGATVAMIISYSAVNASSPEEFKQDFLDWLKELAASPSRIVRDYFGYHTLLSIVPIYLEELKYLLKEWVEQYQELNAPIASSLALAYKEKPSVVKQILNEWYHSAISYILPEQSDIKNERLLATVALTYGEMNYD